MKNIKRTIPITLFSIFFAIGGVAQLSAAAERMPQDHWVLERHWVPNAALA